MPATDPRLTVARALRVLPSSTRGKARLARAILGSASNRRDVLVQDRFGHRFLVPQIGSPLGLELLIHGEYEPLELGLVRRWLRPGAVFVDVGANIGCYALPAADAVGPTGRVLAIEASPTVRPYLERNIAMNGFTNIDVAAVAAGDRVGFVAFHEAPSHSFGMGSIAPQFGSVPIQVPLATLDNVLSQHGLEHVDVIKVDVEGFELGVFRGAPRTLSAPDAPVVLFEFLDWAEERAGIDSVGAAQDTLISYGYKLWTTHAFVHGEPPLSSPLRTGGAMMVALKG